MQQPLNVSTLVSSTSDEKSKIASELVHKKMTG